MMSLILPPARTHFYQLPALDHWNSLYRLTAFDIFILIPYLSILAILAIYGIHRYHLVYLYLKHKDKVAQPKAKLETKPRVTIHRALGFNIHHVHRRNRHGFKAGALENGLKVATGELIAIFDADFIPAP